MFFSLAYGCQDDIAVIRKFDINGLFIISFRKDNFTARFFTLMLIFVVSLEEFPEDFNYDLSKVLSDKLLDHMIGYKQVENKITHRSWTQIDYSHIKSALLEEFHNYTKYAFSCIHYTAQIVFWYYLLLSEYYVYINKYQFKPSKPSHMYKNDWYQSQMDYVLNI